MGLNRAQPTAACRQERGGARRHSPTYVSRAFIVEHNGKRRLVINFAHLNKFHRQRGCRYESLSALRRSFRPGDWMSSCDLADAYHHLGVHADDQDYFTFRLETDMRMEYFCASALSFD